MGDRTNVSLVESRRVVLVRHGETEWSATGRHTGRTDIPLTQLGRRQADALGQMIGDIGFAHVLTSPLSRAHETMERAGLGVDAEVSGDVVEWDYGSFEGTRTADVRNETPMWSVWTHEVTGGESVEDVGTRADRAIERILDGAGNVAVFSHGHFLRILASRWIGLDPAHGKSLTLSTATVSELGWERENRVIRTWNEACHLHSLDRSE